MENESEEEQQQLQELSVGEEISVPELQVELIITPNDNGSYSNQRSDHLFDDQNIVNTRIFMYDYNTEATQSFNSLENSTPELENLLLPGNISSDPVVITAPVVISETPTPSKRRRIDRIENERKYIHMLLDKKMLIPGETYKHHVTCSNDNSLIPNLDDYLMLDIIFWDLQVACEKKGIRCKLRCPECGTGLSPIPLGPRKRFMMRKLYCVEECVLLITSMFRCSGVHKHELLGYDPRLLQSFPGLELPFLLFHRAGTTRQFARHLMDRITYEPKFSHIHDELVRNYTNSLKRRREKYVLACTLYQEAQTVSVENLYFDEFPITEMLNCPSVSLVRQCCLAVFQENQSLHKKTMEKVTAEKYFYLDDSFKLPSSLSTSSKNQQDVDLKFRNVLLILNEEKQVMMWQLTKENSFKEIESSLKDLKDRHSGIRLVGCFTNRCCEWSAQLRQVFGEEFVVKANAEFTLEKLSKQINTVHGSVDQKCLNELLQILRTDSNTTVGLIDKCSDLLSSINTVSESIRNVQQNDIFQEIIELQEHISRDCYTNIPSHFLEHFSHKFGELHQTIRKWISNVRSGVHVAMAMISLGLHELNKRRGVVDVDVMFQEGDSPSMQPPSVEDNNMNKLNYVIDILEKSLSNAGAMSGYKTGHESGTEPPTCISKFLMYSKSFKSIAQFVPDILSAPRLVPYFLSPFHLLSVPYFLKTSEINTEYFNDVETLRSGINRLTFENSSNTSEDSHNLLFCVVSFLKNIHDNVPAGERESTGYFSYLKERHYLDFSADTLGELTDKCKSLGMEYVRYHSYHSLNTYELVSNVLHVVVLIITNIRRFPVLPVYPRSWHVGSPHVLLILREDSHMPILLQLNANNVLEVQTSSDELTQDSNAKKFRCRCGRGKATAKQNTKCVTVKDSRYPSRCLCFRAGESCSSLCDCRACGNPHGVRQSRLQVVATEEERLKLRKRNSHEGQQSIKKLLSRVAIKPIRDEKECFSWTFAEYILFEYALNLIAEDLNTEEDNLLTWSNVPIIIDSISDKYHQLVSELSSVLGMDHWLRKKQYEDIEKRYSDRQDDVTTNFDLLE